jgi:hypothetical protein
MNHSLRERLRGVDRLVEMRWHRKFLFGHLVPLGIMANEWGHLRMPTVAGDRVRRASAEPVQATGCRSKRNSGGACQIDYLLEKLTSRPSFSRRLLARTLSSIIPQTPLPKPLPLTSWESFFLRDSSTTSVFLIHEFKISRHSLDHVTHWQRFDGMHCLPGKVLISGGNIEIKAPHDRVLLEASI